MDNPGADLAEWRHMLERITSCSRTARIALVGKYVKLHDAYLSVAEALAHGGYENGAAVQIGWIDSESVTAENAQRLLDSYDGIIIPGGFGSRGIEGMIAAAQVARQRRIPCFGICLGMQIMVIEFARNRLGFTDAHSTEFDPDTRHPVIDLMPDQQGNLPKGGTMRLGAYPCAVAPDTVLFAAYGQDRVDERHRHRYEFNANWSETFEGAGMRMSGLSPDRRLVEAVELPERDFYLGVQFHPEFKSRPNRAHPLFRAFIAAALRHHVNRA